MLETLPDPPPAPPSPKPAVDPFRTAVDLLKQGTRATRQRAGDTSKRVDAIARYRKGLVQVRDVIASGRFSDRVVEAMEHKAQQVATALTHPKLSSPRSSERSSRAGMTPRRRRRRRQRGSRAFSSRRPPAANQAAGRRRPRPPVRHAGARRSRSRAERKQHQSDAARQGRQLRYRRDGDDE